MFKFALLLAFAMGLAPSSSTSATKGYDRTSGRLISAANFGQSGLARSGSAIALCRNGRDQKVPLCDSFPVPVRSQIDFSTAGVEQRSLATNNAQQSGQWRLVGAPFTVAFSQNLQFVSW